MKRSHLFIIWICFCVAVFSLESCSDHLAPGVPPGSVPSRLRVKTLTQIIPAENNINSVSSLTNVSAFSYDAQGRLNTVNTYYGASNTPNEMNTYQYDGQNQLTEHMRVVNVTNVTELHHYNYSSGKVSSILYSNNVGAGGPVPWFNLALSYTNGVLTGANQTLTQSIGISYLRQNMFGFMDSNLTSLTTTAGINKGGPVFPSTGSTTFTFDTKVNPFYGVYMIPLPGKTINVISGSLIDYAYYGGMDNLLTLSKNNILTSAGSLTSYMYEYNGNNLPTKRTTTTNNALSETLYYTYETY